jgi:acyl-CoA reductase-like NAD-dependent aldehyde dehydrogenase
VLPDVDPEGIAEGLFWGAFINNGQTCAALKRLYVPDSIYDQVVSALAAFTAKVPMGVGLDHANFYPKTLVTDIDNDAPLVQEEQFGPALPIIRYTDLEQAVAWANGVDVGLGASVWSADRDKAKEIAARLEAGTVWINGHGGVHPMIPFGGAKKSGYGLEFGVDGLKSVAVPQVISG